MTNAVRNSLILFGKFIASPKSIGAIAPSGAALAEHMVRLAGIENARTVLELGPGTGAFTEVIVRHLCPNADFLAVEADPQLAVMLRKKLPKHRIVAGSAEHLGRIMNAYRLPQADCIVSGLPWATFDAGLQDRILNAASNALRPGGTFVTFCYVHGRPLPGAKRFCEKLGRSFSGVQKSPVIWNNLPPAFIYCCKKQGLQPPNEIQPN